MRRDLDSRVTRSGDPSQRFPRRKRSSLWAVLTLLLVPVVALAQEGTATLSGRVMDTIDGSPVSFASVVVENAESEEQVTGTLTDEDGRFLVQGLPPAEYRIGTSFPGFYPVAIDLFVGELNQSFDLGDIRLERPEPPGGCLQPARRPAGRARHRAISEPSGGVRSPLAARRAASRPTVYQPRSCR